MTTYIVRAFLIISILITTITTTKDQLSPSVDNVDIYMEEGESIDVGHGPIPVVQHTTYRYHNFYPHTATYTVEKGKITLTLQGQMSIGCPGEVVQEIHTEGIQVFVYIKLRVDNEITCSFILQDYQKQFIVEHPRFKPENRIILYVNDALFIPNDS